MEALEIKAALEGIKAQVETKTAEQSVEVKSLIEALEAKMESKNNEPEIILKAITNNWKGLNYNGNGTDKQRRKDFVSPDEFTSELTEAFTKKT